MPPWQTLARDATEPDKDAMTRPSTLAAIAPRAARGLVLAAALAAAVLAAAAPQAHAQSPFAVAVRVNDDIVTNYEIQQRRRFLSLLNAPPEIVAQARETLVNERLQRQAAERFGVAATAEEIEEGVTAFAGQANMSAQQFIAALGQNGVAPETVRDFISVGISWRNVVRARFAASSQVTDAEIDRALAEGGSADAPGVAAVDYATIPIVGGRGGDALARAQALRNRVDTCDDLYGVRPEGFERQVLPPSEIPQDIAAALSRLDPDEMSFDVTRGGGTLLLVTMLCGRSAEIPEGARDEVRDQLFQRRIGAYASGFLEELRADAIIVYGDG
jgi:hypothetical protein